MNTWRLVLDTLKELKKEQDAAAALAERTDIDNADGTGNIAVGDARGAQAGEERPVLIPIPKLQRALPPPFSDPASRSASSPPRPYKSL